METEVRERRGRWGAIEWPEFPAMFEERLAAEDFTDATVLDLGTGEGRLALHLAPRAGRVVGIDADDDALAVARDQARAMSISNATFVPADADTANYRLLVRSPIDFVVASFYMSEAAIRATAKALRPGGKFLFACHHPDNWRESGLVGRFAFSERRMKDLLAVNGFTVAFLGVDRTVVTYESLRQLGEAHPHLGKRWMSRGRWGSFEAKVGSKPFTLTWATLVGAATHP